MIFRIKTYNFFLILVINTLIFGSSCSRDWSNPLDPGGNNDAKIPTNGLVAYYPFNGNANDESGNSYHGSVLGGATITNILTIGDNNLDGVSLPFEVINGLADFSISGWLKINIVHNSGPYYPGNSWITVSRNNEDNAFGLIYENYQNAWKFVINDIRNDHFKSDTTMNDHGWHHIVVTRNGFTARMYIDSEENGNGIQVSNTLLNVDKYGVIIGQEQDNLGGGFEQHQSWAGEMDNIRIYNRSLTEEEIQALYHEGDWGN